MNFSSILGALIFLTLGAGTGALVWLLNAPAGLLIALPVMWWRAATRLAAGSLLVGYYLAGAIDLIRITPLFFHTTVLAGIGVWLLQALLLALPWFVLWARPGQRTRFSSWRIAAAIIATAVPPFGIVNWLSPMLSAGALYPGWGWFGLAATISVVMVLAEWRPSKWQYAAFFVLGIGGLFSHATFIDRPVPNNWRMLDTRLGDLSAEAGVGRAQFERIEYLKNQMRNVAAEPAQNVQLFLPENIIGRWRPATKFWLSDAPAVWVGVVVPMDENGRYYNALINSKTGRILGASRIPMPISLWRPWDRSGADAAPFDSGMAKLGDRWVALSICYEDYLLWPQLVSFAEHKPDVVLSVANNWFSAPDSSSARIQNRSIQLVATLFGVPLARAVNFQQ